MSAAEKIEPTLQAQTKLCLVKTNGVWHKEDKSALAWLFKNGKLGEGQISEERLKAGERWAQDYTFSEYRPKLTIQLDGLRGKSLSTPQDDVLTISDRFMSVSRALGVYFGIAEFFFLERFDGYFLEEIQEKACVKTWIKLNPVLNKRTEDAYEDVYYGICEALDRIRKAYREIFNP